MATRFSCCGFLVAGDRFVVGARQAQGRDRRRLGLDRQVGEDVAHQRLLGQLAAEDRAVGRVVDRLGDPGPHSGGAAHHAVEPGVVDHLDDRPHPGALLADEPGGGGVELDLAGGVGAVAELVLQALQAEAVALAVGRPAREEEAGDAAVGLGEDEEGVALRGRHEPLVAGQLVLGAGAAAVDRPGDGGVGADVGAALLLGHPHPGEGACLPVGRGVGRVVGGGEEARLPLGGQLRLGSQRRDHRIGHRDRAADPGLGLRHAHEGGAAGDVGARPRVLPRRAVQFVSDRDPQQLVPGGVELGDVDPVAETVVGAQLRAVLVGEPAQFLRRAAAGVLADGGDPLPRPTRRPRARPPRPASCRSRRRCSRPAAAAG